MDFIHKWIGNIVSVMIFISFVEILLPNSKMKKYLNLILGFLVMLVIINPLITLLNSKYILEDEFFKISALLNKEEYVITAKHIEDLQKEQLINLYKDRLKDDIKTRIEGKYDVKVLEVDIDLEKSKEDEIGKIKKLYISLSDDEGKASEREAIPIIKIDISNDEKNNMDLEDIDTSLKDKIKKDITNIYNVNNSAIIVN